MQEGKSVYRQVTGSKGLINIGLKIKSSFDQVTIPHLHVHKVFITPDYTPLKQKKKKALR